jgi:predicted nicotinamide N-methyase
MNPPTKPTEDPSAGEGPSAPTVLGGYPAERIEISLGPTAMSLYRVARLEELVDRDALLREDVVRDPPYWAHLWIGARALARSLSEPFDPLRGCVLDLGCGLGLPGLVAAARGAEVWFADREPTALEFVRASLTYNRLSAAHCETMDFTRDSLPATFDAILCAELVYEPSSYSPLCDFLDRHLAAAGSIHLTDAFRSDAQRFFDELTARGFRGERRPWREWEDGKPQGLFLWTFRRAG